MPLNLVAPAGAPISFGELFRALFNRFKGESQRELFGAKIQKFTAARHCYILNSGLAALSVILKAQASLSPEKHEIVIPAYTCYSVASAVVRAGLKIRLVDINPKSLDYDFGQLETSDLNRTCSVVGCNLFGIPNDWDRLNQLAKVRSVSTIDDGAQLFGSQSHGRPCGTFGSAGFYSLGRGKALTTYSGGVIVTDRDDLGHAIEKQMSQMTSESLLSECSVFGKMMLYVLFIRPQLYWIPASMPFLGIGDTVYETDFSMHPLSTIQSSLGSLVIEKLGEFRKARESNVRELARQILALGMFEIPGYNESDCPSYLRLPLLAPTQATRDKAIAVLLKSGIVATRMYPSTIDRIPGINPHLASVQGYPGAQQVVERLFTLPVHPYVRHEDLERIIAAIKQL